MAYIGTLDLKHDWAAPLVQGFQQQMEADKQRKLAIAQSMIQSGQYQPTLGGPKQGFMDRFKSGMLGPQPGGPNMNVGGQNFQYITPQMQAQAQAAKMQATMQALQTGMPQLGQPGQYQNPEVSINANGEPSYSIKPTPTKEPLQEQKMNLEIRKLQNEMGQDPDALARIQLQKAEAEMQKSQTELQIEQKKLSASPQPDPDKQLDLQNKQAELENRKLEIEQKKRALAPPPVGIDGNKTPEENKKDLEKDNPAYSKYLQALADGRMKMTGRSTTQQLKIQKDLANLYPGLDQSKIDARWNTRKDFTTGNAAKNIRSLNTAVQHLNEMNKIIPKLHNTGFKQWNRMGQTASRNLGGNPDLTRFDAIKTALSGELANIYKNSGGTDQEIHHVAETIDSADSMESLQASVGEAVNLMGGRLSALHDQWHNAYDQPGDKDFPVISARSQGILKSMGMGYDNTTNSNEKQESTSQAQPQEQNKQDKPYADSISSADPLGLR